jgi:hypothetical protein
MARVMKTPSIARQVGRRTLPNQHLQPGLWGLTAEATGIAGDAMS